jgi:hypothetical protein
MCYDADERAASRARDVERRRVQDRALVAQMTKQIGSLFPGCPEAELSAIAEHTAVRGERTGRPHGGRPEPGAARIDSGGCRRCSL